MLLRGNLEHAAVVSRRRRQSIAAGELDPEGQQFYKTRNTIEKLFAAIDRSLPPYGETKTTVQYDGALGFPQSQIWIRSAKASTTNCTFE